MSVKVNENGEIELEAFRGLVDIDKAKYYSFEATEDGLKVVFYDENQNVLPPLATPDSPKQGTDT